MQPRFMPVQPGVTKVLHGDVPVTAGTAQLCHGYMPVELARLYPGVTSVLQDTN